MWGLSETNMPLVVEVVVQAFGLKDHVKFHRILPIKETFLNFLVYMNLVLFRYQFET